MDLKVAKIFEIFILCICFSAVLSCRNAKIIYGGVTAQEKAIILETHNKLRARVAMGRVDGQPEAANMMEMVWDDELAAKAQQWANECLFQHDPNREIDRFTMGQNMAIIWSSIPLAEDDGDFPSRIQNWFNEVEKYRFGSAWSKKTGHYSQLVWGETNLVGCGFTYYKDASNYNKLYVCNYGPGGNVVGFKPYKTGKPSCINHGMYPSTRYQGLCSTKTVSPSYSSANGGGQRNSINTYYNKPSYTVYNTGKSSYSSSYEEQQQQQQQQQAQQQYQQYQQYHYQYKQPTQSYQYQYQQPTQSHQDQYQQQQQQQHQQTTYNTDSGLRTHFKITSRPTGFSFRNSWSSQAQQNQFTH